MSEKQIHLLHIEDDGVDKMVVERVLKKLNIVSSLHHAQNGEEALDKLRGTNGHEKLSPFPQIILLDINMPRMNGKEFLATVKQIDKYCKVPIIVYSTSSQAEEKKEVFALGATDYMVKHKSFTELCGELDYMIAKNLS